MKIENVRNHLQETGEFNLYFLENKGYGFEIENIVLEEESLEKSFNDKGLEVWISSHRVAVTKVYKSFTYFKESWKDDQIIISNLLDILPYNYKNNLYFLIVLEFDSQGKYSTELLMEMNKVEKNSKYCRKYILQKQDDLKRIPFFHFLEKKEEEFPYENRFLEKLLSTREFDAAIVKSVQNYFDVEMQGIEPDTERLKAMIVKDLEVL